MNDTIFYRRDVTSLDAILANPDLPDDLRGRVGHIDDWLMSTTNDVEGREVADVPERQAEQLLLDRRVIGLAAGDWCPRYHPH